MQNLKDILVNEHGLNLDGWLLREAADISYDGLTIVGHGYNPNGNIEAWIATIPEPSTIILFGLGSLTLLRRRKYL